MEEGTSTKIQECVKGTSDSATLAKVHVHFYVQSETTQCTTENSDEIRLASAS